MPSIIKSFKNLKDNELDDKADEVIEAQSNPPGSTNFPTPDPPLATVTAALTAYQNALTAAANGGSSLITSKNLRRKELEEVLNKLAKYCELASDGDVEKMLSSGFDVSKPRSRKGELAKAVLKVVATLPGTVKLSCLAIDGAYSYRWECQEDGTTNWEIKTTTASRTKWEGLTSGKKYHFRVVAIGSDPSRVYSDIVSTYIL